MKSLLKPVLLSLFLIFINCSTDEIGVFENSKPIDIKKLNQISIPIFGIENPRDIPITSDKDIAYDSLYNELYFLNFDQPQKSITIKFVDPRNNTFNKTISIKDKSYLSITEDTETNTKYENPVIILKFNNLAYFTSGDWKCSVYIDDNKENTFEKTIHIDMQDMTIQRKGNSIRNPLDYHENSHSYEKNQEISIFGKSKYLNTSIIIGLYCFTNQTAPNHETILKPLIGTIIKTDKNGDFNVNFKIGDKFPSGANYVATGDKILSAHLFTGYFDVK